MPLLYKDNNGEHLELCICHSQVSIVVSQQEVSWLYTGTRAHSITKRGWQRCQATALFYRLLLPTFDRAINKKDRNIHQQPHDRLTGLVFSTRGGRLRGPLSLWAKKLKGYTTVFFNSSSVKIPFDLQTTRTHLFSQPLNMFQLIRGSPFTRGLPKPDILQD
jgi:hypothetical protein